MVIEPLASAVCLLVLTGGVTAEGDKAGCVEVVVGICFLHSESDESESLSLLLPANACRREDKAL